MKQTDTETTDFHNETPQTVTTIAPGEILIGTLVGINAQGQPLVDYPENPLSQPIAAISTLGITPQHLDRQVALLFANGNPHSPVIMGIIHSPLQALLETYELLPSVTPQSETAADEIPAEKDLIIDGKRVVIEGREEIVLKCGEASITLTRAGKILIRGKYLLSHADGVHRIRGGSVQVN